MGISTAGGHSDDESTEGEVDNRERCMRIMQTSNHVLVATCILNRRPGENVFSQKSSALCRMHEDSDEYSRAEAQPPSICIDCILISFDHHERKTTVAAVTNRWHRKGGYARRKALDARRKEPQPATMSRRNHLAFLALCLGIAVFSKQAESIAIPSALAGTVDSLLTCLGRKSDPEPLAKVIPPIVHVWHCDCMGPCTVRPIVSVGAFCYAD
jgi:hypothetical protein